MAKTDTLLRGWPFTYQQHPGRKCDPPVCDRQKGLVVCRYPKGAHASEIFYSLIETAKANEIEPYAYLRHVFKELPYADTADKLDALLPWNVKDQIPSLKRNEKNQYTA